MNIRMKLVSYRLIGILVLIAFGLGACNNAGTALPTPTSVDIGAIRTAAVQTYVAGLTQSAPSATKTPVPTSTETPLPTETPTPEPTASAAAIRPPLSELLKIYIAYHLTYPVETTTECRFYVRPILSYPNAARTGNFENDIATALAQQFSIEENPTGDFNNYLGASNLHLEGFNRMGSTLHIYFSGFLNIYGADSYCKDRQARDQLWSTVLQFKDEMVVDGITDVVIWMDKELLDDLLLHDRPVLPSNP